MIMGILKLGALMVVVMMIGETTEAMELCKMSEDGLKACKPAVTKPNPVDPPSAECCEALSGADLACLCSYRNSFVLPSLGIDPDLAMTLPTKCNLTPPTTC